MNPILQKRIEEAAKKFATTTDGKIMSFAYLAAKQMADWVLQNQWISVEEGLPEEDGPVIAIDKIGRHHIPTIYSANETRERRWKKVECYEGSCYVTYISVTHWMPIPELKGGEK